MRIWQKRNTNLFHHFQFGDDLPVMFVALPSGKRLHNYGKSPFSTDAVQGLPNEPRASVAQHIVPPATRLPWPSAGREVPKASGAAKTQTCFR